MLDGIFPLLLVELHQEGIWPFCYLLRMHNATFAAHSNTIV